LNALVAKASPGATTRAFKENSLLKGLDTYEYKGYGSL